MLNRETISKEQEKKLRCRKKSTLSEEQKWKEMFCVIFPDHDEELIPSPYYGNDPTMTSGRNGSDQLTEYEQYLRLELPRLIRNQLEVTILGASEPLESQIRSQLVDIVRSCQSEAFRAYQSSARPQSPSPNAQTGSRDPVQSLESAAVSTDPPFDMSAWFEPPTILDPDLQISSNELFPNEASCQTPDFLGFSDSGYGSYHLGFGDGLASLEKLPTNSDILVQTSTVQGDPPQCSGPANSAP